MLCYSRDAGVGRQGNEASAHDFMMIKLQLRCASGAESMAWLTPNYIQLTMTANSYKAVATPWNLSTLDCQRKGSIADAYSSV